MWRTLLELDKINEGIYDSKPSRLNNWVTTNGQRITLKNPVPTSVSQPVVNQTTKPAITSANGKCVVVIISDKGRLRAFGTDGVHPGAFVAFPNNLRQFDGQKYEVDQLIWNGKNYRVAGNIKEIISPKLTATATAPATVHPDSQLVIENYDDNLSYHISELEDEGDAEDSVEYFESYPDILRIIQRGSDIIFELSSVPKDEDVIYWILTYALGDVGNDIAENRRYSARMAEIIISEVDFTNALNNNLK